MRQFLSVTKEFLKDDEITIELIDKRLREIVKTINSLNQWNISDINIVAEEIFGQMLNKLYHWNLIATSVYVSGNYAAVDLIDRQNSVAVQVTTRSDRKKIMGSFNNKGELTEKGTVQKFRENHDLDDISYLYVFIIGEKQNYHISNSIVDLGFGRSFNLKADVIDIDELINRIDDRKNENGFLQQMYQYTTLFYESGRMKYNSIIETAEENSQSTKTKFGWKGGNYSLSLASIFTDNGDLKVSSCLTFTDQGLEKIAITFSHDILMKEYFVNYETFLNIHSVGTFVGDSNINIDLQNVRLLNIDTNTAWHLFCLFKELHNEYLSRLENSNVKDF